MLHLFKKHKYVHLRELEIRFADERYLGSNNNILLYITYCSHTRMTSAIEHPVRAYNSA